MDEDDNCPAGAGSSSEPDEEDQETHETGHSRAAASAASNPAFLAKTKFSQEKYLRKKQKKYSKEVKLLKPCLKDFCESGIPPIRADMLGSLLRFSGANFGSTVAVVDDVFGIITAGFLQRGCNVERYVLGRATGQERAQCAFGLERSPNLFVHRSLTSDEAIESKYDSVAIAIATSAETTIQESFEALQGKLKLCGTLVCYSRTIEPLLALLYKLRENPVEGQETRFINVQLTEQMLREHEIVKERTHPIMTQSLGLFQGFLLSAIKVCA
jgi:tRNA (adenine58-N1)-methyltransferase non-catalytic subunit